MALDTFGIGINTLFMKSIGRSPVSYILSINSAIDEIPFLQGYEGFLRKFYHLLLLFL